MFGRWRRASVAGDVVEDGAHLVEDAVALCQVAAFLERNPCALVLSIAALDLLVDAFLDLALEDTGARRLVVLGYLEDVGSIDPVVCATAHDMVAVDIALVDGDLGNMVSGRASWQSHGVGRTYIAVCRRVYFAIGRWGHGEGWMGSERRGDEAAGDFVWLSETRCARSRSAKAGAGSTFLGRQTAPACWANLIHVPSPTSSPPAIEPAPHTPLPA